MSSYDRSRTQATGQDQHEQMEARCLLSAGPAISIEPTGRYRAMVKMASRRRTELGKALIVLIRGN